MGSDPYGQPSKGGAFFIQNFAVLPIDFRLPWCYTAEVSRSKRGCRTTTPFRPILLVGTSKNTPFAIWTDLMSQLFLAKIPQYYQYSEFSAT
jgi:hypothetical protein